MPLRLCGTCRSICRSTCPSFFLLSKHKKKKKARLFYILGLWSVSKWQDECPIINGGHDLIFIWSCFKCSSLVTLV
ncbi:Uncharacterized protein HZ326_18913 [Fusarium oxysporum f. sp. albedinis]|nr:Uncharacterized protein HZ326_18913 [Fusarium oxysporum f. sp. albedinis]